MTATFTVNKYKVTYLVDDEEYKAYEIAYGSSITQEDAPAKEGYTFSGWSEMPETMPAHDVTVTATYETGIAGLTATQQGQTRIYSPNGQRQGQARKGLNIVVMPNGKVRKVSVKYN